MKRIFLTGANGHTGANVVRELLARDYQVVGLVRENSDLRSIAGLDIEIRKGDLLD
jgi:dihydroflavonol-4-reductase